MEPSISNGLNSSEKFINLLGLPPKTLKLLYGYLNPVDCYNLAQCSKSLETQVKKQKTLKINSIHFRFDNEKSCVGVYFDKYKYTGCVFYSWRKSDGNRKIWNKSYYLKPHKLQNYLYCKLTHPKEVASQQNSQLPVDYFEGMMETYSELCSLFSTRESCYYVGVNVNDKKSCIAFSKHMTQKQIYNFRLIGHKQPKHHRVRNVLQSANICGTVRVSHPIGPACMQDKLINSYYIVLDDPEWLTREQLLSLNCVTADIGHNNLTADDLNAFIMQWMFVDCDQTRLERLEITLSPEAFQNKKSITNGLLLYDWDPIRREGEFFDVSYYLNKTSLRDPNHFLDCKFSKDVLREDGRLATILFFGKKLYFLVWKNRFPYRTLKEARRKRNEANFELCLTRALNAALKVIDAKAQEEWNRKTEWLEAVVKSRKAAAEEEQTAKRKYFEALKEFLDTSEPKPKRRLLRTITIFKDDSIP
uniref:FBA_2 domain-containing protein n=1 Tax=Caenorhabditis tropicalis TaxID=1561998 RepID=A0A1I7U3G4_9PELO